MTQPAGLAHDGILPLSVQEGTDGDNTDAELKSLELHGDTIVPVPRAAWRKLADLAFDILTPLPAVAWCIVSIVATVVGYARISWTTPIVSGIFSSLVSVCCAYDVITYHRRILYVPIFPDERARQAWQQRSSPWSLHKLVAATLSMLIVAIFAAVFQSMASSVAPCRGDGVCVGGTFPIETQSGKTIKKAQDEWECNMGMGTWESHCTASCEVSCEPCGGRCTDECTEDPHCHKWAKDMETRWPLLSLCPLPHAEVDRYRRLFENVCFFQIVR